jgi:hypothetical protein
LIKLLKYGNLEVIAGILAWHYFSVRALGERVLPENLIVIGLAVASIYLVDRLLDNQFAGGGSGRHQFYEANKTLLWGAAIVLAVLGGVFTLVFLPIVLIGKGIALVLAMGLYYYVCIFRKWLPYKELWMSALLVAGIWLPMADLGSSQHLALMGIEYVVVVISMLMIVGKEQGLTKGTTASIGCIATGEVLQKWAFGLGVLVIILVNLIAELNVAMPLVWQLGGYLVLYFFRKKLGSDSYRMLVDLGYCLVIVAIH